MRRTLWTPVMLLGTWLFFRVYWAELSLQDPSTLLDGSYDDPERPLVIQTLFLEWAYKIFRDTASSSLLLLLLTWYRRWAIVYFLVAFSLKTRRQNHCSSVRITTVSIYCFFFRTDLLRSYRKRSVLSSLSPCTIFVSFEFCCFFEIVSIGFTLAISYNRFSVPPPAKEGGELIPIAYEDWPAARNVSQHQCTTVTNVYT